MTTNSQHASHLGDLIDACVIESYFREQMAESGVLFHGLVALRLTAISPNPLAVIKQERKV